MRLLFVVQRYDIDVSGGAELHCREFATRLAARGHEVHVLTTCAKSYVDWANFYDPGTHEMDGVQIHRLAVQEPRQYRLFGPLNFRVPHGRKPIPLHLQREWMKMQGPYVPDLVPWLIDRAPSFELVIFFTYLYYTTWRGLPVASGLAPTVVHPTSHDEPPLYLPVFDTALRSASAFAFSTEEEAHLVRRRFKIGVISMVIGIGVDLDAAGDEGAFRRDFGLGDRPYLIFVGRVDPAKGSEELFDFFTAYKKRHPGPLGLVMVGEPVRALPENPDVVMTGLVDDRMRASAIAGALALVQPSYFESFSMVLTEAWAQRKPALVQGHCAVLEGQVRRAGGGIPYRGFAEFEAALELIHEDSALRTSLGEAGRAYVEENYVWDKVLDRYEQLLRAVRR